MILPCPACMARFMVPDERITRKGVKIRCPKCRFVFIMKAGTDKKRRPPATQPEASNDLPAASGAIGTSSRPQAAAATSGTMGEPSPAAAPKRKRRAPEEGLAQSLSPEELARMEADEIEDMDDLVQATEQSGMAVKPPPKLEHLLPQGQGGPSVVLDDSLLAAAAAYTATMGDGVVPAHSVSDTLVDFGPREDDDLTPPARPSPLLKQQASAAAEAASETQETPAPAVSSLPPPAPTPYDAGVPQEQLEAMTPREGVSVASGQAAVPAAPVQAGPAPEEEIDIDLDLEEEDGVITGAATSASAPLSMPTTFTMTALAPEYESLSELEGLLVEEKRALRKGPAAKIIAAVGIVGGLAILGLLGSLLYARLHPDEKKPPSWGHLQLSDLKHDLFERKGMRWIVKVQVRINNTSDSASFRNVNLQAQIIGPSGTPKCSNYAPCGLHLLRKDLATVTREGYHKALKIKAKIQAYNVQINPGQSESCQVLLFCGKRYRIGTDKIKVSIDKKRSERILD